MLRKPKKLWTEQRLRDFKFVWITVLQIQLTDPHPEFTSTTARPPGPAIAAEGISEDEVTGGEEGEHQGELTEVAVGNLIILGPVITERQRGITIGDRLLQPTTTGDIPWIGMTSTNGIITTDRRGGSMMLGIDTMTIETDTMMRGTDMRTDMVIDTAPLLPEITMTDLHPAGSTIIEDMTGMSVHHHPITTAVEEVEAQDSRLQEEIIRRAPFFPRKVMFVMVQDGDPVYYNWVIFFTSHRHRDVIGRDSSSCGHPSPIPCASVTCVNILGVNLSFPFPSLYPLVGFQVNIISSRENVNKEQSEDGANCIMETLKDLRRTKL